MGLHNWMGQLNVWTFEIYFLWEIILEQKHGFVIYEKIFANHIACMAYVYFVGIIDEGKCNPSILIAEFGQCNVFRFDMKTSY